jgi:hypothetical protein
MEILIVSEQPDQPPRQPFGEAVQDMRRDLIVTLSAFRIFCDNAIELTERPNVTMRAMYAILSGVGATLEMLRIPQAAIEQWAEEPLSDVGFDLPLGRLTQTGDPNHG